MHLLKAFPLTVSPQSSVSLLGTAVICIAASTALAQDSDPLSKKEDTRDRAASVGTVGESGQCVRCHMGNPTSPVPSRFDRTDFCLLVESAYFDPDAVKGIKESPAVDIHVLAFDRLEVGKPESLGNQIWDHVRDRLPDDHPDKKKPLSEAQQCLSCHSPSDPPKGQKRSLFNFNSGVLCETCHGNSERWFRDHTNAQWRLRARAEKEQLGQTDVRDPVRRAKLCYSCHIGNIERGRVVTHDMYVGGHPPLPPIEIETFAERMPKHWRTIREKGDFLYRKEFLQENYGKTEEQIELEMPQTRAMLVGGLVSLSESLRLFSGTLAKGTDLAAYDCFACHHELTSKSWRQERYAEKKGRPGQLRSVEWPTALASIGLRQADPPNAAADLQRMEEALTQIDRSFQSRAFGDAEAVRRIVAGDGDQAGLAEWLENKARTLAARTIDAKAAEAAFDHLKELNSEEMQDYYSAVQTVVAMRLISRELGTKYPAFPPRAAESEDRLAQDRKDIEVFLAWRDDRRKSDERIVKRYDAAFRRVPENPTTGTHAPAELLLLDFPTFRSDPRKGVAFGPFLEPIRYYTPNLVRKAVAATPLQQE